ncbi:MAG: DUF309 domain-containing protein [Actinomycetota bacterium]
MRAFNAGDYFLAHETLEEYWVEAPKQDRNFLQGLIHLAVGCLHRERQNSTGAELQFGKALTRLANYPAEYEGVDLEKVRSFLSDARASLAGDSPPPDPPRLP